MAMKILVTGGAGFIGSHFIRYLLQKYPHYSVINLDLLTYCGNRKNLEDLRGNARYRFIWGDIGNLNLVERLCKGVDAIVNFAASTHVDRSIKESSEFIRTNVLGTHALLKVALKNKLWRFLQISTDEVYGPCLKGSFTEEALCRPSSPYAASKAAADAVVYAYYVTYGLPALIVRSTNNFGPYQYPEKVIPLFITNLLEGKAVPLYGDGLHVRDWLFVLDNCRAIDTVLHKGRPGLIYNAAGNNKMANLKLARTLVRLLDRSDRFIKRVKDRPGHDRRYSVDCQRLSALGWSPRISFLTALRLTVEWYKNNPSWWRPLKKEVA
jgi:dTDP-glucose 4,6-dehydratase